MPIIFPPHELADEDGLLAVGGNLESETLINAYSLGIFPWPIGKQLAWFSPPRRAVIFFDKLRVSKSLIKSFKKSGLEFRVNSAFADVIKLCATAGDRKKKGTWITNNLTKSYIDFHKMGYAHSFECFKEGKLVGGVYGVGIGKMFSAESMFHLESNASKFALLAMFSVLNENGYELVDCQQFSKTIASFGAEEISRADYLQIVRRKVKQKQQISILSSEIIKILISELILK